MGIVSDVINQARNQNLKISNAHRARCKQITRPEDRLRVIATPLEKEAESYCFRIMVEDELVCSNMMTVEMRKN